jgi:hypothetical protein
MNEVNVSIEKIDGGFLVCGSSSVKDFRKIVRKLSEVVAIIKEMMTDPVTSE